MYDHTCIASYRCWGVRSVGKRVWLQALDGRNAELARGLSSNPILSGLRQTTPIFCRHQYFADAYILLMPIFCRCQYFVYANILLTTIFCQCLYFTDTNILLALRFQESLVTITCNLAVPATHHRISTIPRI